MNQIAPQIKMGSHRDYYKSRNAGEIRQITKDLRSEIGNDKFVQLMSVSGFRSTLSFMEDWISVFVSVLLVSKLSIFFLPLSLIVIGSRQRAISNLVHDGAHFNLFASKKLNDFISNIFGAFPMFDNTENYRGNHTQHHTHLGSLEFDPDSKSHLRYGFNDRSPSRESGKKILLKLFFNLNSWGDSVFGGFLTFPIKTKVQILISNSLALLMLAQIFNAEFVILLMLMWVSARISTYHFIRIFAEFMDHAGLSSDTVITFTRNLPHHGLLPWIFHPHQDTYHLVHHLFPKIPHYNLHIADKALRKSPLFLSAHHCDSYFLGSHTAISCLSGKCLKTRSQM